MRHYVFSEKQSRVNVMRQSCVTPKKLHVMHDILSTTATFSSLAVHIVTPRYCDWKAWAATSAHSFTFWQHRDHMSYSFYFCLFWPDTYGK